jgi:hypothetical protein
MDLTVGMRVQITTENAGGASGWFTGTVVKVDGHVALIDPDDKNVRMFLGGQPYDLGSAHWGDRVKVLPDGW